MGRYPLNTKKKLLAMVAAGKAVQEAAEELGVSKHTAYGWTSETGVRKMKGTEAAMQALKTEGLDPSAAVEIAELKKKLAATTLLMDTYKKIVEDMLK